MGRPFSLTAAALAALCLCVGCGAEGAPQPTATDLGAFSADLGLPVDYIPGCRVRLTLLPAQATAPALIGASAFVESAAATSFDLTWQVTLAGDATPVALSGSQTNISFPVPQNRTGQYTVRAIATARLGNIECHASDSVLVTPPGAKQEVLRVIVTPPPGKSAVRDDTFVTLYTHTPVDQQLILLDPGILISAALVTANTKAPVPGTIHFLDDSGGDVLAATSTTSGAFSARLHSKLRFSPIALPSSPSLAPVRLGTSQPAAVLASSSVYNVAPGVAVSGVVRDTQGQPIAGARLVLRSGDLPSSVGVSDTNGQYTLQVASAGSYQLSATVPAPVSTTSASAEWPELVVPGLAVAAGTSIDVRYQVTRLDVGGRVVASDGATPVAGARVTLRSRKPVAQAATVTVAGQAQVAAGDVRVTALTLSNGDLPQLLVPAGDYDALIEPPPVAEDGVTTAVVTAVGMDRWSFRLSPRITLRGRVVDGNGPVPDARVTAVERVGLGTAPRATTDSDGRFALTVDRDAPVELVVEPPFDLARPLRRTIVQLAPGTQSLQVTVLPGMLLGGRVTTSTGAPIGGAVIDVSCAVCAEPGRVAVGATETDGSYAIIVPDPG